LWGGDECEFVKGLLEGCECIVEHQEELLGVFATLTEVKVEGEQGENVFFAEDFDPFRVLISETLNAIVDALAT
jgi:hypothetical protein